MSYIALYRKWRPDTFDSVVEQEHVVKTLKNAVRNDKIAHAYLFSGTRGTGKTTMAKLLARAINCDANTDGNPCNKCDKCLGILDGSILDIIEIDAASNNSVDNIRDIRDEVIYTPAVTRFKVYIIDEVHMLSTGAFNALLKTLEEPPSHVVFILATTEPHKLPATILSRCQKYDFKRISPDGIYKRLELIINDNNLSFDKRALRLIARYSKGSFA
jgi:DNA polymerase-3 subunit gamma/tau